jgi:FMN phosphatase YigB (HAD superfamily)
MARTKTTTVLFDWDLTLARVLGDVSESERLATLFNSQGLNYTSTEVQVAIQAYQETIGPEIVAQEDRLQTRQDIINFYFQILAYLGYTDRDWAFGDRLYSAHGHLPTFLYDDTLPTLRMLQQKGVALGIISNHARSARTVIEENVGQFVLPEHIIISQEVGVHKPSKTIFRCAISRLGASPASCMFVGNNLAVDAIAAVQQGGFGYGLWLDRKGVGVDAVLPKGISRITSLAQVVNFV